MPRQDALIRDGIWDKNQYQGRELRGQTLGIVGFGFIGQTLAKMAGAIGMEIIAFDPHTPQSAFVSGVRRETDLDTLLASSDIVSLHCPLTPETNKLIDARRIGLMKPGALLINTDRGEVVDEAALSARYRMAISPALASIALSKNRPASTIRCSSWPTRLFRRMWRA
jgi:D-3-phosphoglycerate dehydrogenase